MREYHDSRLDLNQRSLLQSFIQHIEVIVVHHEYPDVLLSHDLLETPVYVLPVHYEDVPDRDLVACATVQGLARVSLSRYLADKVQCVAERAEARDLVDIHAVLEQHPELADEAKAWLAQQDALLLVERLQAWTDAEIAADLRAYPDVDPADARQARDVILAWLRPGPMPSASDFTQSGYRYWSMRPKETPGPG